MRLFYDPNIDKNNTQFTLSEEESKHAVRVLRLSEGDHIGLMNGRGFLFSCEIAEAHPKRCLLNIVETNFEAPDPDVIHIAVAPTKQMERIEWFVEKAVEIGVTKITLLDCKNGERAKIKLDRLEKKAISAMKQSQRKYLPEIDDLTKFNDFISKYPTGLIAHCYDGEKSTFSEVFAKTNCPILIGPEGDFTLEEVKHALDKGYKTITLGKNRLRTETAALYACMNAKMTLDR
jgi:16S rRNA (uracil1498-N3)-methyltransferase